MNDLEYKIVRTGDGTSTLYSQEYSQTMHSDSGAYEEALLKHVYPCGILNLDKKDVYILDLGFGLGYNALASIVEFSKKKVKNCILPRWKKMIYSSL